MASDKQCPQICPRYLMARLHALHLAPETLIHWRLQLASVHGLALLIGQAKRLLDDPQLID